jgi:acetoin utilization deacetylase AcuC-like enzyme
MCEADVLGRMCLSEAAMYERDVFAIEQCVSRGIPVACVVAGGYDTDRAALAARHSIVVQAAAAVWQQLDMVSMPSWQ